MNKYTYTHNFNYHKATYQEILKQNQATSALNRLILSEQLKYLNTFPQNVFPITGKSLLALFKQYNDFVTENDFKTKEQYEKYLEYYYNYLDIASQIYINLNIPIYQFQIPKHNTKPYELDNGQTKTITFECEF